MAEGPCRASRSDGPALPGLPADQGRPQDAPTAWASSCGGEGNCLAAHTAGREAKAQQRSGKRDPGAGCSRTIFGRKVLEAPRDRMEDARCRRRANLRPVFFFRTFTPAATVDPDTRPARAIRPGQETKEKAEGSSCEGVERGKAIARRPDVTVTTQTGGVPVLDLFDGGGVW